MMYKTIVLQMLEQHPEIYDPLRKSRRLLPALDTYAQELKDCHEMWSQRLSQASPDSEPGQIASEALELALRELENRLFAGSPPDESDPLPLDAAMASLCPTPPA